MAKPFKPTKDQALALKAVVTWLRGWQQGKHKQQVFRLFGFAGTGKTTLAKYIAAKVVNGEDKLRAGTVNFAAFTGKAAARLKVKGCVPSSTIHRLIYKPVIDDETGKVEGFVRNMESPIVGSALCIVDEVSMVNTPMGQDLEWYAVPILVLGDPGQLPPVEGEGYFTQAEPDYMLTEVTRQAKESPIVWLATKARMGEDIEIGKYGNDVIVLGSTKNVADKWLAWADQILCGTNATRIGMQQRIRHFNGNAARDPIFPVKGEKLVCLKNNHDRGLLNGTHWQCTAPEIRPMKILTNWKAVKAGYQQPRWVESPKFKSLWFNARSMDFFDSQGKPEIVKDIQVSVHRFNPSLPEPPWRDMAATEQFDFGDPLTVHKAQGSEWDRLVLLNEAYCFREHYRNHLYTGITRAVEKLVIRL